MEDAERVEDFLEALTQEIVLRREEFGSAPYGTIFFGGGTPSLLAPRQLESILTRLHAAVRIASDAEITLEANPGTVTPDSLRAFRALGVNRLSVGIQSFHDRELIFLGRLHDRAGAFRCIGWARSAGFENIGIDLMYAIPGQTLSRWEENLRTAVDLGPQHIAAYSLIVEERTPFGRLVGTGEIRTAPVELEARMYERTMEWLAANGYDHYEVSNYALPGYACRHNGAYWSHEDYLGFGPSAHSFQTQGCGSHGRRWWNVSDLSAYTELLARGLVPVASEEHFSRPELILERVLLGLRSGGLDLARLRSDLGYDFESRQGTMLQSMVQAGLAVQAERVLRLTPAGYLLCDEICNRLSRDVNPRCSRPHRVLSQAG